MEIGEEKEAIIVEPIEDPFRKRTTPEPKPQPSPVKVPEKERELTPA